MKYLIVIILGLLLSACAPESKSSDQPSLKSLGGVWKTSSMTMTISPISVAGGTIIVSYGIGGTCQYNYGNTWSDPELHDPNAGTISIADGVPLVSWPSLSCSPIEGNWTYAVLVSNSLQLCQSQVCLEFQ